MALFYNAKILECGGLSGPLKVLVFWEHGNYWVKQEIINYSQKYQLFDVKYKKKYLSANGSN